MPKKIKILVTGAVGLVGSHFVEISKHYHLLTPSSSDLDITKPKQVEKYIEEQSPDWIINFAAFTDVNAAEEQKGDTSGSAWKVNVDGVQNLLDAFKSRNFIQISTDMVFPGTLEYPGPYAESDEPPDTYDNLTWYGWTKNRAEKLVKERKGVVLRIIYPVRGTFDKKLDYIRGPLKRFLDGKMYPLFHDQQVSVSLVSEISETIQAIIEHHESGTFHVVTDTSLKQISKDIEKMTKKSHHVYHVSSDTTTPHELISRVLSELGLDEKDLKSSSVIDFLKTQTNPARYPIYGGLKTKETEEKLDLHFSSWQTVIEHLLGQGLGLREL